MTNTNTTTTRPGNLFYVDCPMCETGAGLAEVGDFAETTIRVVPCVPCVERTGAHHMVMRKSYGITHAKDGAATRHQMGLVVFA